MIVIDMPMPESCAECRFSQGGYMYCHAMPENFCRYVNYCEEDGRPEWCPLKQNKRGLEWITPEKDRDNTRNKLYIAYRPGYPLVIVDWRTGHGYRDVRTGESIDPVMVAYINLPVETRLDQIGGINVQENKAT